MKPACVLAPQAALDLVEIWRYIKDRSTLATADRVESVIREKFALLAASPEAGHKRTSVTDENVKFFPVYSYLIVYRPETKPLRCVHPSRPSRRGAGPKGTILTVCRVVL
jgi:antitoxin ParD1/3/4/toxin ParE1/3/4